MPIAAVTHSTSAVDRHASTETAEHLCQLLTAADAGFEPGDYKLVMRALEAGASGFLLKGQRVSELIDAVRTVHAGGRALAAELVSTIVDRLSAPASRRYSLTEREADVLSRLADGATTVAVAKDLRLSVNTVRNHVQSAIRRLGAHSKLEAISVARREGLIGHQPDP